MKMKQKRNYLYFSLAIILSFLLAFIVLWNSIYTIKHTAVAATNEQFNSAFEGFSADIFVTDKELYDATNTYQYKIDKPDIATLVDTYQYRNYDFYDMQKPITDVVVSSSDPQITVLTHGLGSNAANWSNDCLEVKWKSGAIFSFMPNDGSLLSELEKLSGDNGISLFWVAMENSKEKTKSLDLSFKLIDLQDSRNLDEQGKYLPKDKAFTVKRLSDISKHIVIVFESANAGNYNNVVYEEFNYMLSKIIYDVKYLSGGILPKINLVGHSRGGITNLQYALDHPDLIASIYSMGTPYFGTDTGNTSFGKEFASGNGRKDIVDREIFEHYCDRWNKNYNRLYKNIDAHALGGYSNTDFFFDALIQDPFGTVDTSYKTALEAVKILLRTCQGLGRSITGEDAYVVEKVMQSMQTYIPNFKFDEEVMAWTEILSDIHWFDSNSNVWNNIVQILPFTCPYFMNDTLVDLASQTAFNKHGNRNSYLGFQTYEKCFTQSDYNEKNPKRLSAPQPAVVHNLETLDTNFIAYIIENIDIGSTTNGFLYFANDSNSVSVKGYRGSVKNLTKFIVPEEIDGKIVTDIDSQAFINRFSDNSTVLEVMIPASVERIGSYAFYNCSNIEVVTFSAQDSKLQYIGEGAFAFCTNLSKFNTDKNNLVQIPSDVMYIGENVFYMDSDIYTVKLNNKVTVCDLAFSNMPTLSAIVVASDNEFYMSYNGDLYNKDGCLVQYAIGKTDASFVMPERVSLTEIKQIGRNAFNNAKNLTSVNLSNVETIRDFAFSGCEHLANLTGTGNIQYISKSAFADTRISKGNDDFWAIGNLLYEYTGTASIITKDMFPSSVTRIGEYAFLNNDIVEEIYLPLNILSIGASAFDSCNRLKKVQIENLVFPTVYDDAFTNLGDDFAIYCAKSLKEQMETNGEWTSVQIHPIVTQAYFTDIDKTVPFYYGENILIPNQQSVTVGDQKEAILYWQEIIDDNGGLSDEPLRNESYWNRVGGAVCYKAKTQALDRFYLSFKNGDKIVGGCYIYAQDEYSFYRGGVIVDGIAYDFVGGMDVCYYNGSAGIINADDKICTFEGWELEGKIYTTGKWNNNYNSDSLVLTAKWRPNHYYVTLDFNDGTGKVEYIKYTYFETTSLPVPQRNGFRFREWRSSTDEIITTLKGRTEYFTLTAQWDQLYFVTCKSTEKKTYSYTISGIIGEKIKLPKSFSWNNYEVDQWGEYFPESEYVISGNITLLAKWRGKEYKVIYHNMIDPYRGSTAFVDYNLYSYRYGEGLDLSGRIAFFYEDRDLHGLSTQYWHFKGFYSDKNLENKISGISKTQSGDVNIYVKWTRFANEYEMSYTITSSSYANNVSRDFYLGLGGGQKTVLMREYGFNYIAIRIKFRYKEVDDGYQHMRLVTVMNGTEKELWYSGAMEHGHLYKNTNYKDVDTGVIYIPLEELDDTGRVIVQFKATGAFANAWRFEDLVFTAQYVHSQDADELIPWKENGHFDIRRY